MNDVQSRHLLRDKKHGTPLCGRGSNDVRDRLGFACARWALNDQMTSPRDFLNSDRLRRVSIDYVVHGDWLNNGIDFASLGYNRIGTLESVLQKGMDQSVKIEARACRPVLRI